jgi:hypothetical protein
MEAFRKYRCRSAVEATAELLYRRRSGKLCGFAEDFFTGSPLAKTR